MIVADTNVVVYLHLPGPNHAMASRVLAKDPEWAAPLLWRSEFRNVLLGYVKRGGLDVTAALQAVAEAEAFMCEREYAVRSQDVLGLALRSGCTSYDCEFVALAYDLGVPLVTSDARVLSAFPDAAVSVEVLAGPP
jgi:predicted nucleic acid-binding protein